MHVYVILFYMYMQLFTIGFTEHYTEFATGYESQALKHYSH